MNLIEVAIMEPKYQQNLGYIARISKNFGIQRLLLINPRCNHKGREAIKYSKHAHELLENAIVYKSLNQIKNSFMIGTTGIWHKTNASFYNVYSLSNVEKLIKKSGSRKICLLLGRDDTGLSKEELKACDATLFIETSKEYPILNISHALAIMLYCFRNKVYSKEYKMDRLYADPKYQEHAIRLFDKMVKRNKRIRDKAAVKLAFKHILRRSMPTRKEINAISIALSQE